MIENSQNDPVLLSIVIPAYNEEKKICEDLSQVYNFLNRQSYGYEVLMVDDGSKDKTYEIGKSLESKYKNLRCIRYEKNRGKGYAVKTGILQAKGEYILFSDAGTCVPYQEVERGLHLLQDGYDVAIGSRILPESKIILKQPLYRQLGSKGFNFIIRWFMGIRMRDTQCGFKVFKREAAHQIFSKNRIDRMMFDIETIFNATKLGFKMKEFPVTWKNDPDTRFNPFWGSIVNLKELFIIKFGK